LRTTQVVFLKSAEVTSLDFWFTYGQKRAVQPALLAKDLNSPHSFLSRRHLQIGLTTHTSDGADVKYDLKSPVSDITFLP